MDYFNLVLVSLLIVAIGWMGMLAVPGARPSDLLNEIGFALVIGLGALATFLFLRQAPQSASPGTKASSGTTTTTLSAPHLDLLKKSTLGAVAVSAPASAVQYRPFVARLALEPSLSTARVEASVLRGEPGAEVLREERVWIAPVMEAGIQGLGFDFITKQSYAQPIAAKEPTVWTWQVVPVDSGPLHLEFRISGKFKVQEETLQRDLFTKSFVVTVDVNPEGFFKRNWEKLLTMAGAAVTALVGGIWAYLRWWRPTPDSSLPGSRGKAKQKR